jgi:hypothetical protein
VPPALRRPVKVIVGERTEPLFGPGARDIVRDTGGTLVVLEGEGRNEDATARGARSVLGT